MKVVINGCYGGFSVSDKGLEALCEMQHPLALAERDEHRNNPPAPVFEVFYRPPGAWLRDIPRDDPGLVKVVEKLGAEASGTCANLKVVEIPDGVAWEIDEYDGMERVAEKHRRWW